MKQRGIYFRLIVWYSGLVAMVSLLFGLYTYQDIYNQTYGELEKKQASRARYIADTILPAAESDPQALAEQIETMYSPEANNRFIRILNADHSILYISDDPRDAQFLPRSVPVPAGAIPARRIERLPGHLTLLVVTVPARVNNRMYFIETGISTDWLETIIQGLLVTLLFGLPLVVLIVSAGGHYLVRSALQPVEAICATAERISFGNLSNRLPVAYTGDELERLSVTLNRMLERLDTAYGQASRFSADASHELRTPLTIVRTELELIINHHQVPDDIGNRLGSVLEEIERMSYITEGLLALSRFDAGEAGIRHERFDLAALSENTAEQMALLAEEKHIRLRLQLNGPVWISGDAARIRQVVVNLLGNAIKYTPEGGNVTLGVSAANHQAVLEVSDTGIGIPPEALPHVFERFYRIDKVRSRDPGGSGLGLCIVRSICQAHGGSVDIRSEEGKGTACRVNLPLANT